MTPPRLGGRGRPAGTGLGRLLELFEGPEAPGPWTPPAMPAALHALLPWRAWDEASELYVNAASTGFVVELPPFAGIDAEALGALAGTLADAAPERCTIQVIHWASPRFGAASRAWAQPRAGAGGALARMGARRSDLLSPGGWRRLHAGGPPFTLCDYRVFVTASLAGTPGPASETALGAFRRALEGTLASAGAGTRRLEPDGLLSLAAELVAPDMAGDRDGGTERPVRRWSPRDPIHEQCIAPGRALTVAPTGLTFHHGGPPESPDGEDVAVRVLSAVAFPEVWPGWRGNALIGDFHRDFLQPGAPVLTCLTVVTGDEAAGEKAFLKSARATQQAGTGIARYLPGLPEKARDWQAVTERLKDGERLVRACYTVAVYAPLDALDEAEQAVRAIYHGQGWRVTEQAFTLPNDLAYRRHGLIFGARLAAATTRLEITDTVFARNIRNYARQCVFHALLLGHISADDLRESTDIWSLVTATGTPSAGASPARMFEFATRQPGGVAGTTAIEREIVTCQAGAVRLNAQWNVEIARAGTVFGRRIFPDARTEALARAELLAALPAAHDFLIGASRTAGEIMRQQMVLNAVHDAGEQWAAEAGNAAALRAYTEARAEAQTVSAYRAIGRQAETWVPLLKIVFECLYIGAFPMAVLLMLTPAGTAIFRSYVTGLIWLQSWGPLYAVLHRISMGEAAERMSAAAAMPNGEIGISLVAQAGIRAVASDVAVMSGYLSMSVPFLAAALAYGLSKATVLATSVLAVGQDAASSAAHEGTTGNLSLANTGYDTHRFATLEGRQIRTSTHVDTDRYTGYAPAGAAMTVTGDGTVVADAGQATSRIPAAGVRLSESLATSHETRAAEARTLSRHWSAEAGQARNAAVTDATAMIERYAHDVSTGTAHARGVTESESSQAQELSSHVEKLAEIGGISKDQAAVLTGQARVGGGWDFVVKAGADGSVMWRGQTIESDAWNRIKEYDRQHGVTETWSQVADASKRYSTQTGDSEMASLDESLSANFTRMRSFQERASLARQESESWSEQAAQVRSDAQAIGRDLGQPFFAWLSERKGTDGRALGAAGAMRIASPQTAEDSEQLREYAAAFIAEKYPAPAGPDPASVGGAAEYDADAGKLRAAGAGAAAAAHADSSAEVRDRARDAGAPRPGETGAGARGARAETETDLTAKGTAREARQTVTRQEIAGGAAGVEAETKKPFEHHATENLPVVGEWLAGKLFGTAKNAVPDAAPGGTGKNRPLADEKGWGDSSP